MITTPPSQHNNNNNNNNNSSSSTAVTVCRCTGVLRYHGTAPTHVQPITCTSTCLVHYLSSHLGSYARKKTPSKVQNKTTQKLVSAKMETVESENRKLPVSANHHHQPPPPPPPFPIPRPSFSHRFYPNRPPWWLSGKASVWTAEDVGSSLALPLGLFPGRDIPVTSQLVLKWLSRKVPRVLGSELGLVGPVSAYCGLGEIASLICDYYLSLTARVCELIRPWDAMACWWGR